MIDFFAIHLGCHDNLSCFFFVKTMVSLSLFIIILVSLCKSEETVSIEVGTDGTQKTDTNSLKHPNALEVIFENQSGRKVELYWDDNINGILQSKLDNTAQITINTFIGHRFYFTPKNSNGSKENILYQITMEKHLGIVTLYDPKTMKDRNQEFERKKSLWMKEYFESYIIFYTLICI